MVEVDIYIEVSRSLLWLKMNQRSHYPVVQIVDGVRKFRQLHVLDQEMLVCTKLVKIEQLGSQFHVKWYRHLSEVGDLHSYSFMT